MNKADFVDAVADRSGLSRVDAQAAIEAIFDPGSGVIFRVLESGDRVRIGGFGVFESRQRARRRGRNPRTGASVTIPARSAPAFRAGQALKRALNRER